MSEGMIIYLIILGIYFLSMLAYFIGKRIYNNKKVKKELENYDCKE